MGIGVNHHPAECVAWTFTPTRPVVEVLADHRMRDQDCFKSIAMACKQLNPLRERETPIDAGRGLLARRDSRVIRLRLCVTITGRNRIGMTYADVSKIDAERVTA